MSLGEKAAHGVMGARTGNDISVRVCTEGMVGGSQEGGVLEIDLRDSPLASAFDNV